MVAVGSATALQLSSGYASSTDETKHRLRQALQRSLVAEGIGDDLIATLDEVLADRRPAYRKRRLDSLLIRMGLPLPPRQRPQSPVLLTREDAARIASRFRRATRQLEQVAPYRTDWHPTDQLRRLAALRDEQRFEGKELSYLRQYALAILDLLDLMGDDA